MVVAGLQKNSLIDFPGKVSAVVFITGCNFSCPYCHNPELARGQFPQRIHLDDLLEFLHRRRALLDGVVITGGEPTLWPHLSDLCKAVQELDLAVKLDTNGSRPEILRQVITNKLVDYIAMDIKTSLDNYAPPLCDGKTGALVKQSITIIMDSPVDYEFRTTCAPPFVDEAILVRIAREIQNARRYILQPMRQETMLTPEFFDAHDGSPTYSASQMDRFKSQMAPLVRSCRVR